MTLKISWQGFFSYHAIQWLIESSWKCKDRQQAKEWLENLLSQRRILPLDESETKFIKFGTYFYYFNDNYDNEDEDIDLENVAERWITHLNFEN